MPLLFPRDNVCANKTMHRLVGRPELRLQICTCCSVSRPCGWCTASEEHLGFGGDERCPYTEPFVRMDKEQSSSERCRADRFPVQSSVLQMKHPNDLSVQKRNHCQQCPESDLSCSSSREANVPLGGIAGPGRVVLSQASFGTAAWGIFSRSLGSSGSCTITCALVTQTWWGLNLPRWNGSLGRHRKC